MLFVLIIYNCDFGRKFHEVGVPFGDCLASLRHGLVCTSACKVSHKSNLMKGGNVLWEKLNLMRLTGNDRMCEEIKMPMASSESLR